MKIAGQRTVLHVYDLSENDRDCLKNIGYEYFGNDIADNEMWDREENYFVGDKTDKADSKLSNSKWAEIVNNYFDEDKECYTIDAWLTNNNNEEGKVIARVYTDGKRGTEYYDDEAKTDVYAQSIIQEVINKLE